MVTRRRNISLHALVGEKSACLVHPVKCLVGQEPQLWRVFQRHRLGHQMAQLALVAAQRQQSLIDAVPAQGQHEGRCHLEVARDAHFAHGYRKAVQVRIMHFTARQDIRKRVPDQFADAKLTLRGAFARRKAVLCHRPHVGYARAGRNGGFAKCQPSG